MKQYTTCEGFGFSFIPLLCLLFLTCSHRFLRSKHNPKIIRWVIHLVRSDSGYTSQREGHEFESPTCTQGPLWPSPWIPRRSINIDSGAKRTLIWCRKPIINYSVCIKYHHVNTTNWYMHQLAYICIGGFTMHLLWFLICLLDYNNPIGNTRAKRGKRHRCLDLEFAEVEGRKRESKATKDLCLKLWILNLWWWKKERIIGKGV